MIKFSRVWLNDLMKGRMVGDVKRRIRQMRHGPRPDGSRANGVRSRTWLHSDRCVGRGAWARGWVSLFDVVVII